MELAKGRRTRRARRNQGTGSATEMKTGATASATIESERREEEIDAPTVREVRILGLERRPRGAAWSAGRAIQWLGRDYVVVATADRSRSKAAAEGPRHYLHLADPREPSGHAKRARSRRASAGATASCSTSTSTAPVAVEARGR